MKPRKLRIEKGRLKIKSRRSKHAKVSWCEKILIGGMVLEKKAIHDAQIIWIRFESNIESIPFKNPQDFSHSTSEIRQLVKD